MTRFHRSAATVLMVLASAAYVSPARADFEITGPDGRRILLKDDGTWSYVDSATTDSAKVKTVVVGEAVLSLERRIEVGRNCRFALRLVNNFTHEIQSIVPSFSAFRTNGVLYETVSTGFFSIKPGNQQSKEAFFQGIACPEIARVQVTGGDRCEMGDLDRFSNAKGECLARVRVVASDLVQFDK